MMSIGVTAASGRAAMRSISSWCAKHEAIELKPQQAEGHCPEKHLPPLQHPGPSYMQEPIAPEGVLCTRGDDIVVVFWGVAGPARVLLEAIPTTPFVALPLLLSPSPIGEE